MLQWTDDGNKKLDWRQTKELPGAAHCLIQYFPLKGGLMRSIIYLVGLVVVIYLILSFLGLV